ncbi:spore coat protein YutH [Neobacillus sp. PS3-12]|uniref:spore coat putative kinase YutH n=1 Tax=Neobacillus sp. PS3-12 TaxID=3070677 RepID=UPI0027DED483|nr:spore coat protein YutH [Neobacillus sp. PS3-12]WML54611.1 spore coat protein YutH [Neobacillus sp. PS3-12]
MLEKLLENQYGVKVEERLKVNSYEALRGNGWVYLFPQPGNRNEDELNELESIANHMRNYGDRNVPVFLPSKEGKLITEWENNQYCVMAVEQANNRQPLRQKSGRKLAKFHERGRMVPFQIKQLSRIGQWKQLWEKRLEQMEKVWNGLLFQTPEDDFERQFIDSFPYYMGLTENAIQYLVDTEIDDEPTEIDNGTVCHERFSSMSWGADFLLKNPFDWVFDHRSRDIAEWTRERYFRNNQTYQLDVKNFFQEYLSVAPLSVFSWKLLYSRILFPLHYFECVENYYITRSEQQKKDLEEQLSKILRQSMEYERFLSVFYELAGAPIKRVDLIKPEWLH